jgi:hypothetical protein
MDGSEQHADDVNGHHYHYLDSFPGSFVLLSPSAFVQSALSLFMALAATRVVRGLTFNC